MRAVRLASAVVVSAVLIGGLTACGSDAKSTAQAAAGDAAAAKAADLDPKAALAASAAVMKNAKNAKINILGGEGNASGSASWDGKSSVDVTAEGGDGPNKVRVVGGDVYLGGGAEIAAALGGKHWTKPDPKDPVLGPIGGVALTTAQMVNPVLQLTAGAAAGKPSKVGSEQVDGTETVHYHTTQQTSALVATLTTLTPEQRSAVEKSLGADGQTLTIDFWINAKQELVQVKQYGDKNGEKSAVTVKYSGLGTAPKIEAPAAGDIGTADLSKLLG
ncbi:hypothetical protein ACWEQL_13630 [Kitasatospora sp. NPDC004240]